jgi:AmmeMemoRadiSam system protein A
MFQLSESDQQALLRVARESVQAYLAGRSPRLPEIREGPLLDTRGVFVSLHKDDELRGCIGNLHPTAPLYRVTSEAAISAAVGDPRFMPMTIDELPYVRFEISVLSPMEKIDDVEKIEIGRDGILISKRGARGLLLPQVAVTQGWDRERFLTETCRKAGLRPGEWKEDATIFRFSAQVFGEPPRSR